MPASQAGRRRFESGRPLHNLDKGLRVSRNPLSASSDHPVTTAAVTVPRPPALSQRAPRPAHLGSGVGMGIASRWIPILERGGFSPIPFFYVIGGSLVFVFLTWHIPSVAGSMMAGAVSLSDAVYPAILGSWAAGTGLVTAGTVGAAAVSGVRWGVDRLRVHTSLHTVNGDSSRAQPSGTGVSAPPPPDTGQAEGMGKPQPERPKAPAPAAPVKLGAAPGFVRGA